MQPQIFPAHSANAPPPPAQTPVQDPVDFPRKLMASLSKIHAASSVLSFGTQAICAAFIPRLAAFHMVNFFVATPFVIYSAVSTYCASKKPTSVRLANVLVSNLVTFIFGVGMVITGCVFVDDYNLRGGNDDLRRFGYGAMLCLQVFVGFAVMLACSVGFSIGCRFLCCARSSAGQLICPANQYDQTSVQPPTQLTSVVNATHYP